jgi:hypothetical protein
VPGIPSKVREGREIMVMIVVANIKKIEGEYAKLYEDSTHIWMELVEDPEMKVLEEKLIEAHV